MNLRMLKQISVIIFIIVIVLSAIFLGSIIKPIVFSIIIAYMLNPFVKFMQGRGINKRVSALTAIFIILAMLFFVVFYIIPGIMRDVLAAIGNMDLYAEKASNYINNSGYHSMPKYLKDIMDKNIMGIESASIKFLNAFVRQIIDFSMELPTYILTPIFVYYFLVDVDFFLDILKMLVPVKFRCKGIELGREIDRIIGGFIRGQLILSLIIAGFTFIILLFVHVRYPIIIAIINGLANIIPYFGPIIGLLPAVLAGLTESVNKAIIIGIAFLIAQELESSVIAPKLMSESIGIHPVFVMIALLIGGKYFGAWGLIFSIPVAGVMKVTWNYFLRNLY